VIVDEGQDFTLSNYSQQFIPHAKKSISIFGDTNQKIYKDRNCNIEDVAIGFKYPLLNLNFNYRVPKTIAKVAQNIPIPHLDLLTYNKKNNGNSDYPSFPKPIIKKCVSEEEELQYILKRIQTEGLDDVAILLPQEAKVKEIHKFFSDNNIGTQVRIAIDIGSTPLGNRKFHRIDTLDFTNLDLPSILTYHSAKGTEFDNVFIPFADEDNGLERNPFYVAVTRSSSRVFITYSRKLTTLLKDVSSNDVIYQ
jgi:superfamily I DNA/RNA helicase